MPSASGRAEEAGATAMMFWGDSSTGSELFRTIPIASSVSRIAASRGSISSEKIEVRLDCIWGIVFALRT